MTKESKWYLVYSKPRMENTAHENLKFQGYESYLPMVKGDIRKNEKPVVPMFPSYLFCRMTPGESDFTTVENTYGVRWMVKSGQHYHVAEDRIIESLKSREDNGVITAGRIHYEVGDAVVFKHNLLKGYRAVVKELRKSVCIVWAYTGDKDYEVAYDQIEPLH